MTTLAAAKETVRDLLAIAGGDAEVVYNVLKGTEHRARRSAAFTEENADHYGMLRLALSDLAGNADYRR